MNTEDVFYFDGSSARPSPVRVLLFQEQVHLRKDNDAGFGESFPVATVTQNQIGHSVYFYLDPSGLRFLQLHADHPVATLLARELADTGGSWVQRLVRQRIFVLLVVTMGLGVGLYLLLVNLVPYLGMRLLGVQQEITMGRQLKEAMLKQAEIGGEAVDSAGTLRLRQFAGALRLSRQYPIEVTLVKSKTVNAYALPGGQIVVYSGIVEKMNHPEELVALLAHEATHVNERHSLRSLLRSAANGILISVVFGDASGLSGTLVSGAETLHGLQYSRRLEAEADRKGMDLMVENGVDVKGMKELMQTLQQEDKLPDNLSFISSHPLTKERIQAAEEYSKAHAQATQSQTNLQSFFDALKAGAVAE